MSGSLSDEWNKIDWDKAFMDKCREAYKPSDDKSQWIDPIMPKPYEFTDVPYVSSGPTCTISIDPNLIKRIDAIESKIKEYNACINAIEASIAKLESRIYDLGG